MTGQLPDIKSFTQIANETDLFNIDPPLELTLDNGQAFKAVRLIGHTRKGDANFLIQFSLDGQLCPDYLCINKTSLSHFSPLVDGMFSDPHREAIGRYCHAVSKAYNQLETLEKLLRDKKMGNLPTLYLRAGPA